MSNIGRAVSERLDSGRSIYSLKMSPPERPASVPSLCMHATGNLVHSLSVLQLCAFLSRLTETPIYLSQADRRRTENCTLSELQGTLEALSLVLGRSPATLTPLSWCFSTFSLQQIPLMALLKGLGSHAPIISSAAGLGRGGAGIFTWCQGRLEWLVLTTNGALVASLLPYKVGWGEGRVKRTDSGH